MILKVNFLAMILLAFIITGCARTSTLYSNTFIKPTKTITDIKVLYIENKLIEKQSGKSDTSLVSMGYNDLPELFKERIPLILKMNGISAEVTTIQKVDFAQKEAIDTIQWAKKNNMESPLLIIQIVDGTIISYKDITTYDLNIHANLFDSGNHMRQWTGQFKNRLTKSLLVNVGFDNDFVDKMIKIILEQMIEDGFIKSKGDKIIISESKSS